MTFGEKLKKYRTVKGFTQTTLGTLVGLSADRIRQYECDVRHPKEELLIKIAKTLEINPIALKDADTGNPDSVMHVFFELEDIYGMRIEKTGESYQISFKTDHPDSEYLIKGMEAWINKRTELQPDINDSKEVIASKKEQYALWKACYPDKQK